MKSSLTTSAKPVGVWGCVSAIDREGRTIWIADAHRDDGRRFIVRAEEKQTAFLELERAIHEFAVSLISLIACRNVRAASTRIASGAGKRGFAKLVLTPSLSVWQSRGRAKSVRRLPLELSRPAQALGLQSVHPTIERDLCRAAVLLRFASLSPEYEAEINIQSSQ